MEITSPFFLCVGVGVGFKIDGIVWKYVVGFPSSAVWSLL